jgi:hypothetical protein
VKIGMTSCPMVSTRFLQYSNWIFFVSACDPRVPWFRECVTRL